MSTHTTVISGQVAQEMLFWIKAREHSKSGTLSLIEKYFYSKTQEERQKQKEMNKKRYNIHFINTQQ